MERCRRNNPDCTWRLRRLGCHIVSHHIYFPASAYTTPEEIEFRELPINRVDMCKDDEERLHAAYPDGTPKPRPEIIQYVIERERLKRGLKSE